MYFNNKVILSFFCLIFLILSETPAFERHLYVIGPQNNPPFEFVNSEGTQVGFSIDLFRRAAAKKNLKYEIDLVPLTEMIKLINESKPDVILGSIPDFNSSYRLAWPYLFIDFRISVLKYSKVNNIGDLKNKKAAFIGSMYLYELFRNDFEKSFNMEIVFYENHNIALKELYAGTYDAVISTLFNGRSSIKDSGPGGLRTLPVSFGTYEYSFAVRGDNPRLLALLSDALVESDSSGFVSTSFRKWFPSVMYNSYFQEVNLYVLAAAAGLLVFIGFFFLNNKILNRRIRDHTEKLNTSLAELQEAQTLLKDNERKFKTIFEQSPAGLIIINSSGEVLLFNNKLIEIFGLLNPEELYRMKLGDVAGVSEQFYERLKGSKNVKHEIEYSFDRAGISGGYRTSKSGTIILEIIVQAVPISSKSGETGYLCQFKDITETKKLMDEIRRSSEQYRLTFEAINDGLWDWDIKTGNIFFNRRIFSMLGYIKEIFPQNVTTWQNLIHPEDRPDMIRTILDKIRQDMSFVIEYRMRKKDGSWLWVEGRGQTIEWDSNGEPVRVIGTHTDISRKKEIEFKLIREKEKAQKNEELKTIFLHNVSHEIRTPLNGIIGFSRMLAMPNLDPETRGMYSKLIEANSDQIMNILSDIVDYSLIEKEGIKIQKHEFSCNELMHRIFEMISHKAEKTIRSEVKIICRNLTDERDFIFYSDMDRILQVMENLISNSLRFTGRGFIEFGYSVSDGGIRFFVLDEGLSIGVEEAENFFDRYSSDPTRGRSRDIGISIAGDIVEALGGTIHVDPFNHEGVMFYFVFPISEKNYGVNGRETGLKDKKILVVDDNYLIFFHLSEFLRSYGSESLYAQNGYEAIEIIKERDDIDAVLMDMQMPGIDGISALKEVKKIRAAVPVIIQTGHVRKEQVDAYFSAGCDNVIEKPIDENLLVDKLTEAINKSGK